jgi:aryl-alcohol dehydrogenase-like predicted oxidoreductase
LTRRPTTAAGTASGCSAGPSLGGARGSSWRRSSVTYDEANRIVTRNDNDVVSRIRQECEDSLRRLQTDYIDLYQFHKNDYDPGKAAEVRNFLEKLVDEGKIRWYGWSTDNPEGAQAFAQGEHCTAIQHWLNMRYDTPAMLAVCDRYNQASVNRSPLGSGMMTGKFTRETTFPEDDMRSTWDLRKEFPSQRLQRIAAVRKYFAESGDARTQAQIALAWIWMRSERTIPIPGFKTAAQVKENIAAMEFGLLGNKQMMKIDQIFERPSGNHIVA